MCRKWHIFQGIFEFQMKIWKDFLKIDLTIILIL